MVKRWTCLSVLLVVTLVLDSCNSKKPSKGTIGFSAMSLKNPFFKVVADSLSEEAERQGYEVITLDAERDVKKQSDQIDNFIAQKVTAIVINPADRIAIGPAIKKANEAGIPVFTNDLQCVAEGVDIAGHIGTDNFQGGRLAGEAMIEALGEDGGQIIILHFKQANSCVLRVNGFREVVDKHNASRDSGRIEIVEEHEGAAERDKSREVTETVLPRLPELAGIFAINDPSAIGAWNALKQAGRQDRVLIVGFDGALDGKKAIKAGRIFADPIQFPDQMGIETMQNIVKYLEGKDFEKVRLIPTKLYRKADADADPELK